MSNVIRGPWGEVKQYTIEEKNDLIEQALVEELTDAIFDGMRAAGFDNLGEMCYTKDLALISESIRSYLRKLQDDAHPMQRVAEEYFGWDENGGLYTTDSVHVDFE